MQQINSKLESGNTDEIYWLNDCDNIYIKSAAVFLPTIFHEKQAVIFNHHLKDIASNIKAISNEYPHFKYEIYYNELSLEERDQMRAEFEARAFQFLFATPNRYEINGYFEPFVNEQTKDGNILIGLEVRNKDFPGYNPYLARLKEFNPQQKWVVFTDYDEERLKLMQKDLHLTNARVINMRDMRF